MAYGVLYTPIAYNLYRDFAYEPIIRDIELSEKGSVEVLSC